MSWSAFGEEHEWTLPPSWESFNASVRSRARPPLPDLDFVRTSQHRNLYVYPQGVDYLSGSWG